MVKNIIIVDKEKDITSNQTLMKIKNDLNIKKCGFVGTLDPFATGLLLVCCNNYTKLVDYFHLFSKTYVAQIKFSQTTNTLDVTGKITYEDDFKLKESKLQEAIDCFETYDQIPPMFSAKKINGKRAYELARDNKVATLKSKKVHIYAKKILSVDILKNEAVCEFEVSSGTYIRTLCDDIAKKMGTRSYLVNLRRTKIGNIGVEDKDVDIDSLFKIKDFEINNDFELKLVKNGQIPLNISLSESKYNLCNIVYKNKKIALFDKNKKLILFYD